MVRDTLIPFVRPEVPSGVFFSDSRGIDIHPLHRLSPITSTHVPRRPLMFVSMGHRPRVMRLNGFPGGTPGWREGDRACWMQRVRCHSLRSNEKGRFLSAGPRDGGEG